MGVYAKGLEIPNCCHECKLRRIYQYMKPCPCPAVSSSLVAHKKDWERRREGCPLIEVKEPHGRLIDADALADDLEYDAANEQDFYKANCASWLRSNCNQTIIEAEGMKGEEEWIMAGLGF